MAATPVTEPATPTALATLAFTPLPTVAVPSTVASSIVSVIVSGPTACVSAATSVGCATACRARCETGGTDAGTGFAAWDCAGGGVAGDAAGAKVLPNAPPSSAKVPGFTTGGANSVALSGVAAKWVRLRWGRGTDAVVTAGAGTDELPASGPAADLFEFAVTIAPPRCNAPSATAAAAMFKAARTATRLRSGRTSPWAMSPASRATSRAVRNAPSLVCRRKRLANQCGDRGAGL